MAKKAPDVVTSFVVNWGEENVLNATLAELTEIAVGDDEENLVVITPDGEGGVTVTVGPIEIAVRKPTTAEKRQKWERVIEVTAGLDDESVILGEECGAAILSDEDSDEAE